MNNERTYLAEALKQLPSLSKQDRQFWIENKKRLRIVLAQALVKPKAWTKEDNFIFFELDMSKKMEIRDIPEFGNKTIHHSGYVNDFFKLTPYDDSIGKIQITIISGYDFITSLSMAKERNLIPAPAYTALAILNKFSDEEILAMGLDELFIYHNPIQNNNQKMYLGLQMFKKFELIIYNSIPEALGRYAFMDKNKIGGKL